VDCRNKSDTSKNMGNWNHIKIIQTIPELCTGKPHQGITENSHIGHCTDTAGSADVKVPNINVGNSITCTINRNYRTAATLNTLETWFDSGNCKYHA